MVILLLSCILVQTASSPEAILPYGDLLYSNFLAVGKELEWQVSVLDWSGNDSIYFDAYIDETNLSQGDKVKLTVILDPNAISLDMKAKGTWLNISFNGKEKRYNISDIHLGDHTWVFGDFFISPVVDLIEDTHAKLFEEYYSHVISTEYNDTEYYTDIGEMYYIHLVNTETLLFNITKTLFKETFYYCEYLNIVDNRYENEEESLYKLYSVLYESIIDTERGTLYSYKCYIDSVYNYTSELKENEYIEDYYHLFIENYDKTSGYSNYFTQNDPTLTPNTILGINVNHIVIGMATSTALLAVAERVYSQKKKQRIRQNEKQQIAKFADKMKCALQSQERRDKEEIHPTKSSRSNLSK